MCGTRISGLWGIALIVIVGCSLSAYGKYGGGSGTPEDPYQIRDANHMQAIGADANDWDKHFKLMADIDLSSFTGTSFNIIGNSRTPFTGIFHGNDHEIIHFTYLSDDKSDIGLFGRVDDPCAVIKDMTLFYPDVDGGFVSFVGILVGVLENGNVVNCHVQKGMVKNDYAVLGGLVGYNGGLIQGCSSTCSLSGSVSWAGGITGANRGTITDCFSAAPQIHAVSEVGGLAGANYGTIRNSYSVCATHGGYTVGGLVGENRGLIFNCYTVGTVRASAQPVGGFVGENIYGGQIYNSYSNANVKGRKIVGGLVGENRSTITNCYSTGSVSGDYRVGGLVAYGYPQMVTNSFWDIETSGQATSVGGTGLPTDQMQMMNTFTDASWDFMGETANGIEDIWFIPQQDYPHLWWEGMNVPMKLTPRILNCRSQGNWVKAHLTLPEGFTVADVDSNRPAVLHSFGFQSTPLYVFVNVNELVEIEAAFEREEVCSLAGNWPEALTVAGFLADGNIFLGTSTVRMIAPGMKLIEELAWYWLNADCVQPDFCNDIDMNRDSIVNLLDYALLMNIEVEFVTDE